MDTWTADDGCRNAERISSNRRTTSSAVTIRGPSASWTASGLASNRVGMTKLPSSNGSTVNLVRPTTSGLRERRSAKSGLKPW